ncbi:hypothetical protein GCM10022234_00150 [Aeromicrobium panaciterrae]|uniref:hypothetical protein n=1 Tax=Aeromicrobium panaciterrae TaxID=363861 RepID=UPI0031D081A7
MAVHVNKLLNEILRDELESNDRNFGTSLPPDLADQIPFVHAVHSAGSLMDPEFADWASIVIDAYGASDTEAFNAAQSARTLVVDAWKNQTQFPAGYISFFDKDNAVPPFPAPAAAVPDGLFRYTAEYRLLLRTPLA